MQTEREWLVERDLAKPGRGKFSNAAKEALAKARAEGVEFKSTGPTKPVVVAEKGVSKEAAAKPAGISDYLWPSDFRFPEAEYVAVARDKNGKRVVHSMRECCNTCRVSLTNHGCDNPTILGEIPVKIEAVKS
jgi:hypothetical protein